MLLALTLGMGVNPFGSALCRAHAYRGEILRLQNGQVNEVRRAGIVFQLVWKYPGYTHQAMSQDLFSPAQL